jgi:hypothetical protein
MVEERSTSAQRVLEPHEVTTETAGQPHGEPTHASIPKVDLSDLARRAEWLAQMAASTADAVGAGRDATEAYSQRVMSRHEARRHIEEAADGIASLLAAVGYEPDLPNVPDGGRSRPAPP